MAKKVKNICMGCGMAIEYTRKEKILNTIGGTIISVLSTLGVFMVIYLSMVGIHKPANDFINARYMLMSDNSEDELRNITVDLVRGCASDSFCGASRVYDNVSGIDYVLTSFYEKDGMYDALEVYEAQAGECRNVAMMYSSMLRTVGFDSYVDCSIDEEHCVSVVPYVVQGQYKRLKAVVDLTVPLVVILEDDEDVWDFMHIWATGKNDYLMHYWR